MRIAVLSSASAGGAGIAAYRIYEALEKANHEVDFIDINTLNGAVSLEVSPQISATNKKVTNTHFTVDHASDVRDWLINLLSEYDVINVQWASYLVSLSELLELAKLNKKIVFTMHDFYYITGGCHYPAGCNGFLVDCAGCPQVSEKVLSQKGVVRAHELKKEIFSHPNVILSAPSRFIVDSAINSGIVPSERAVVIRNAYEPIVDFNPESKSKDISVLLIADSFDEQRKGLALAIDSLKLASKGFNKNLTLHLVGGLDEEVVQRLCGTRIEVVRHGHIKDHSILVDIFRECHFILSCSYEDNWPNILVESACYGCIPIVGKWHGCEEFVNRFNTGFLSEEYTPEAFSNEIRNAMGSSVDASARCAFVENVREMCAPATICESYINIFEMKSSVALSTKFQEKKKINYSLTKGVLIAPSPFGPQVASTQNSLKVADILNMAIESEHVYGIIDSRYC